MKATKVVDNVLEKVGCVRHRMTAFPLIWHRSICFEVSNRVLNLVLLFIRSRGSLPASCQGPCGCDLKLFVTSSFACLGNGFRSSVRFLLPNGLRYGASISTPVFACSNFGSDWGGSYNLPSHGPQRIHPDLGFRFEPIIWTRKPNGMSGRVG